MPHYFYGGIMKRIKAKGITDKYYCFDDVVIFIASKCFK